MIRRLILAGLVMWASVAPGADAVTPGAANVPVDPAAVTAAEEIFKAAGRDRGLCLLLAGDGKLAAALHGNGKCLVRLIAPEQGAVNAAREYIESLGIYGPVSAEKCSYSSLPPAGNLANFVVIDDPAQVVKTGQAAAEIVRVLRPGGAILIRSKAGGDELAKALKAAGSADAVAAGGWLRVGKPRPAELDDWSHAGYGPDNSRVSRDKTVGPPNQLQWLTGPVFPIMGEHNHYGLIISAGGRSYYMLSWQQALLPTFTGPAVSTDQASGLPQSRGMGTWIVARDAFNGLQLWRRPYDGTANTMVADGHRVYTVLADMAVALDGESGKVVAVYGKVDDTRSSRFMFKNNMLLFSGMKAVNAFDTKSGKQAWTAPMSGRSQFLIEGETAVLFESEKKTLCGRELVTGKELWKFDSPPWMGGWMTLLFSREGLLVFSTEPGKGSKQVVGVSVKDGKMLWSYKYDIPGGTARATVLYAAGQVWIQKWMIPGSKEQQWEGLDPETGKVKQTFTTYRTSSYGCHPDVATDRHVVFNRPSDFMSLTDGKIAMFRGSRPACGYGASLANGLFYSAPNTCVCLQGWLHGFVGLGYSPSAGKGAPAANPAARLEQGPSFGKVTAAAATDTDWPTFRHDPARSASSSAAGGNLSPKLVARWKTPVAQPRPAGASMLSDDAATDWTGGDILTAPTVAGGLVYAGVPDRHSVVALDAASGKKVWSAVIGARMDVPPTIYQGLCLVGGRDGYVYALRAADGTLVWRFRAAPEERQIVAFGQLESVWPVVGGVLVKDGMVYALAGRTSESDGGVRICCLEPATGKLLWETCPPNNDKGFNGLADMLVADGGAVSCGGNTHFRLDLKNGTLMGRGIVDAVRAGSVNGEYHGYVGSAATLLDKSWRFAASTKVEKRFQTQWKDGLTGQVVVFDKTRAVGIQRYPATPNSVGGKVVAQNRVPKVGDKVQPLWSAGMPAGHTPEALALAGENVLVGTAAAGRQQGLLLVLNMKDGAKLADCELGGAVASEGIAVAGNSVYVSNSKGEILSLAAE